LQIVFLDGTLLFVGILVFILFTGACKNPGPDQSLSNRNSTSRPGIEFKTQQIDLGEIIQDEIVGMYFKFRNKGSAGLKILQVNAGCRCTVPDWEREIRLPGATSELEVKFDSANKDGKQRKNIMVKINSGDG